MKSLWNDADAAQWQTDDLQMRVYTSRLLGQNSDLVLHGGGNTSVKTQVKNLFGETEEVLYVKGSGWDLETIEAAGFAPVKLDTLQRMASLPVLSDSDMVRYQRAAMLDPNAPNPSVEAILHAIIPYRYVDHSHADAVVAISNTPNGKAILKEIYGDNMLFIPYVMPGFILAQTVYKLTQGIDWQQYEGMILLNHGIFSFDDDAKTSYESMISLVSKAEDYLAMQNASAAVASAPPSHVDLLELADIRQAISHSRGRAMIAQFDNSPEACGYAQRADIATLSQQGPLTPDHVIRTKRLPLLIQNNIKTELSAYQNAYQNYFDHEKTDDLTMLNPTPCWAVWQGMGTLSFGQQAKEAQIISDIIEHSRRAMQWSQQLGAWQALPAQDIFEVEYWELEQAKLKKSGTAPSFQGKIALVTGAASGIGQACAEALHAQGAVVLALDIDSKITDLFQQTSPKGQICDVTDTAALQTAVDAWVTRFGGLDIIISNAGIFTPSQSLSDMDSALWQKSLAINLSSHQQLLQICSPYLQRGIDPAVVIMGSKNVPAPGPGAGAYSVAKAGLTQMARVAALELGAAGIRVNVLHPNAVFDTAIWTNDVLSARAKHYGMSVTEYKTNNLLKTEVTSMDVANLACALAGSLFSKTTGAQIPIDGGNERVI